MAEKLLNNRYLIKDLAKDQLGQGSFGKTYLARDTRYKSEQKVVVKHLQPNYNNCRSAQQREYLWEVALKFFRREAVVLEKLGRMSNQIPTLLARVQTYTSGATAPKNKPSPDNLVDSSNSYLSFKQTKYYD
jgi:serine/threonine protein kinase, bacterial